MLATLLVLGACDAPEDQVEGRIEADVPLLTPISGRPACFVALHGDAVRRIGDRSRNMPIVVSPRFAEGARFVVDGRPLRITGVGGSPSPLDEGARWRLGRGPAPARLADFGGDAETAVRCFGGPTRPSSCTSSSMEIRERYAPCGATLGLRGQVNGDVFTLHDSSQEELASGLAVFGASALCLLCPVAVLVGGVAVLIFWLARRKKNGLEKHG